MRLRSVCTMLLITLLLCAVNSRADTTCGLWLGDRVELIVNHPEGNGSLHVGHRGTVVCLDPDDLSLPLLVSFDGWVGGHEQTSWCHTSVLPHLSYSCWWTRCNQIKKLPPNLPDFSDSGEQDRSFTPQTLIAGKANQPLEVSFTVVSGGTGNPPDATYVDVYASSDTSISPSDYKLGSTSYFYISAGGLLQKTLKTTLPTNIPPGFYYIGWIIDPADLVPDELDETNNVAYVTSYRLLVSAPAGTPSLELSAACGGRIANPGEGVFSYPTAKVVSVEAVADPNCTFVGWTGTAVDAGRVADASAAGTQVTVDGSYALKALFDGPHMVLEDFEEYNDPNSPMNAVWVDGVGWRTGDPQGHRGNGTGAVIGSAELPMPGNPTVHGGAQAMALDYDNRKSPYYSEASRRWGSLQNWSATGADNLSIWFRGAASNSAQPLSVAVEDFYGKAAVAEYSDSRAVLSREWTQWTIPLEQIESAGVTLSRIIKISIDVGENGNRFNPGAGTLYFDDITLIHSVPEPPARPKR